MKFYLSIFLMVFSKLCYSQNDSTFFMGITNVPIKIEGTSVTIPAKTVVCVGTFLARRDNGVGVNYWRICYMGKNVLIPEENDNLHMPDSCLIYLKTKGEEGSEFRDNLACANDVIISIHNKKKAALEKHGVVIEDWSWGYESEYSYSTYAKISILNTSKKTIKYLWFDFIAFDAVDERILSYGKQSERVKGIGPIAPDDYGSYKFESVFHSRVVDKMQLNSITVQFMDGTKKVIAPASQIIR